MEAFTLSTILISPSSSTSPSPPPCLFSLCSPTPYTSKVQLVECKLAAGSQQQVLHVANSHQLAFVFIPRFGGAGAFGADKVLVRELDAALLTRHGSFLTVTNDSREKPLHFLLASAPESHMRLTDAAGTPAAGELGGARKEAGGASAPITVPRAPATAVRVALEAEGGGGNEPYALFGHNGAVIATSEEEARLRMREYEEQGEGFGDPFAKFANITGDKGPFPFERLGLSDLREMGLEEEEVQILAPALGLAKEEEPFEGYTFYNPFNQEGDDVSAATRAATEEDGQDSDDVSASATVDETHSPQPPSSPLSM